MIPALSLILLYELVGEVASRALDLPLPGPVLGLCLLLVSCMAWRPLADLLRPVVQGILSHLSLFFVPAGVGVVANLPVLREYGLGLAVAVAGSTLLAIAAGAWAFVIVARWIGDVDED